MLEKDYLGYKELFKKKRELFLNAVANIEQEQSFVLQSIINANKKTEYGKKYNFDKIHNIKDFQNFVQISNYESYVEYITKIKNGKKNILTSDAVLLLEPTGGSTSGSKLVPYTESLKKAFNKGIEPWLSDLFLNYPEILTNPMYWSISPFCNVNDFSSKIPIGFDDDMQYLTSPFTEIISSLIIAPNIKDVSSTEEFYRITLETLSQYKQLAFISIWNPTLFLNLIENIDNPSDLWRNLKIISCWDEGNSQIYAERLQNRFPNAKTQGKGLLATEGIMTIPIEGIGKLPCVQSHFYEFLDTQTNKIKLLHELDVGKEYSIILTTQGGFYRYEIGDIVKVYGKYKKHCPLLKFVGRKDNISDYFGEKLNEKFVQNILNNIDISRICDFYLFAPFQENDGLCYTLYAELKISADIIKLNENIETSLQENYHYKYARQLGQLNPFKISKVSNGVQQYFLSCKNKGQRLGDIKPIVFSNDKNWDFKIEE